MSKEPLSSIDEREVSHFNALSSQWWDDKGALKTLHHINPIRVEYVKNHINISNKRLLDIGCGGGILSEALAEAGAIVTGLDADHAAIDVAKAHALQSGFDIDYFCQPVEAFNAEPFDVITCMEMLEHVQNPVLIIEHAARLLKAGGTMVLSTINKTPKAYAEVVLAAEYILGIIPKRTHDYQRFITPAHLSAMCRQHGLQVLSIDGLHYNPLTTNASINQDVRVNYLLVAKKLD